MTDEKPARVTWQSRGWGPRAVCSVCTPALPPGHCILQLKFLCVFVFFSFSKLQKTREARHVGVCGLIRIQTLAQAGNPASPCVGLPEVSAAPTTMSKISLGRPVLVRPATGPCPSPSRLRLDGVQSEAGWVKGQAWLIDAASGTPGTGHDIVVEQRSQVDSAGDWQVPCCLGPSTCAYVPASCL